MTTAELRAALSTRRKLALLPLLLLWPVPYFAIPYMFVWGVSTRLMLDAEALRLEQASILDGPESATSLPDSGLHPNGYMARLYALRREVDES